MRFSIALIIIPLVTSNAVLSEDWPTLGRDRTRNSVSPETGLPLDWQVKGGEIRAGENGDSTKVEEDRYVRWQAELPGRSYATPVVSQGLVWIGSSFPNPGKAGGSLSCFREVDGALIYERRSQPLQSRTHDAGWLGLGGSPLVEADRLWYVTNRWEVVCLDIGPLLAGKGMPREVWGVDLVKEFGVFPRVTIMGPPRHCSIGPSLGDRLFVTTANGIDETYVKAPAPEAPALVCLDKNSGRTLWTDASPGANVHFSEVASPLAAEIGGREQVVVPQGDGWLRSFDPATGKLLWQFDLNRKETAFLEHSSQGTRNQCWSCPVLFEERIYVTTGQEVEQGDGPGRLVCIDPTKSGDISSELAVDRDSKLLPQRRVQAVIKADGERAIPNPNSGLIWEYDASHADWERQFHRSLSSAAIKDGLLVATDVFGMVHCLDARTGKFHWSYDVLASIWGTPLIVDGHVYVLDEDGEVTRFRLSADPKVGTSDGEPPIVGLPQQWVHSSPIYANGTLYLASSTHLFAIGRGREPRAPRSLYVPTPPEVVAEMLKAAKATDKDLIVDLGSGDGRIVIAAAQSGAKGVGYEIDRQLVEFSRANIAAEKLEELVTIREQDFYQADFSDATVVTAFLYPAVLEKLKPQFDKLKAGTRIVTHSFAIPGAVADETIEYKLPRTRDAYRIYLYKTPLREEQQK